MYILINTDIPPNVNCVIKKIIDKLIATLGNIVSSLEKDVIEYNAILYMYIVQSISTGYLEIRYGYIDKLFK